MVHAAALACAPLNVPRACHKPCPPACRHHKQGTHNFSSFANVSEDGARKSPVKTITRYELLPLENGARWAAAAMVPAEMAGWCLQK